MEKPKTIESDPEISQAISDYEHASLGSGRELDVLLSLISRKLAEAKAEGAKERAKELKDIMRKDGFSEERISYILWKPKVEK